MLIDAVKYTYVVAAVGDCSSEAEAYDKANKLGYPVMIRPSYVLGGRAMEILYSNEDLKR